MEHYLSTIYNSPLNGDEHNKLVLVGYEHRLQGIHTHLRNLSGGNSLLDVDTLLEHLFLNYTPNYGLRINGELTIDEIIEHIWYEFRTDNITHTLFHLIKTFTCWLYYYVEQSSPTIRGARLAYHDAACGRLYYYDA